MRTAQQRPSRRVGRWRAGRPSAPRLGRRSRRAGPGGCPARGRRAPPSRPDGARGGARLLVPSRARARGRLRRPAAVGTNAASRGVRAGDRGASGGPDGRADAHDRRARASLADGPRPRAGASRGHRGRPCCGRRAGVRRGADLSRACPRALAEGRSARPPDGDRPSRDRRGGGRGIGPGGRRAAFDRSRAIGDRRDRCRCGADASRQPLPPPLLVRQRGRRLAGRRRPRWSEPRSSCRWIRRPASAPASWPTWPTR